MGKLKLKGSEGLNTDYPQSASVAAGTDGCIGCTLQKVTWPPESASLDTCVAYLSPEEGTIFQIRCQVDLVAAVVT